MHAENRKAIPYKPQHAVNAKPAWHECNHSGIFVLNRQADHTLDLRGFIIPIALLKVSQVFREMLPEQTLEIHCHDEDIKCDLLKILPAFSYELVFAEETNDGNSFRLQMKKKHG